MRNEADRLLGESPVFLQVLEDVSRAATLNKPVLIVGERGTGKEGIAARLHYLSPRWGQEFIKLNCAGIADSLLENELFGHEPGAFTGATKIHQGRFERAHNGTLFLDELANTSLATQEKILRVIEYGEFERVGGSKTITCDVRLVAATNEDLPRLAEQGKFRADLLDRLAFDVITLPPLRERASDILILAEYFGLNMAKELDRDYFPGFSAKAKAELQDYVWPGNARELKNVVERAVYKSEPESPIDGITLNPFDSPFRPSAHPEPKTHTAIAPLTNTNPHLIALPLDLKHHLREQEIELITAALDKAKHNQRQAAKMLKLTYHQLRGYLRKYDLVSSADLDENTKEFEEVEEKMHE
ncbi:MAG: phage shock protein operon transcriptional activator [Pseudomonadales bacterium]|jgi:psp operon transcriptional activator|tara:strand:+ start:1064 stop:2137 length:1074 start_codon:yes stop_codon:yes gene_type:complete